MAIHADREPPKVRVGYLGMEVTKPPNWHGLVTIDLLVNNLATGLFLAAALGELARPGLLGPVARLAYPLALVLLLCDLICLILDLGSPTRFHHMLRVFKPTSPMSLGTWSLSAYSLALASVVAVDLMGWLDWLPAPSSGFTSKRSAILALGVFPAFAAAIYKGVLFSTSSQPGWKDARWLGAYLGNSAVTYGTAGLYVLAFASGDESAAGPIRPALGVLVGSNVVFLGIVAAELRPALVRSHARGELSRLAALAAGVGVLAPLCLVVLSGGSLAAYAAFACLVLGGVAWRHAIVMLPHQVQHSSQRSPS